MSYLLFQITFLGYLLTTIFYFVFFATQKKVARQVARHLLLAVGILHTAVLVTRYFEAGHTPITSNHEAVSFFAWAITWGFLSFRWRYHVKNFGVFTTPLITILMLIAALSSEQLTELPPALQSNWLPIHASIAIMANGFLALAFCGGIMYLLLEREIKNKRFGVFYSRLPSLEALDTLNHHCLAVGFPLLTLGIITGSIWAKQAWGAYWQWDPKETWSLITWLLYAALIHQRMTMGWRGRRAALVTIIGFGAVLFTLWGVSYLLGGQHSYVG
jgi:cytochrome c-type biogenesis protein CcsB